MSKVSKVVKNITRDVVKACDRMKDKADIAGKDMYYGSQTAGYRAEKMTDQVVDKVKEGYHSIIDDKKD